MGNSIIVDWEKRQVMGTGGNIVKIKQRELQIIRARELGAANSQEVVDFINRIEIVEGRVVEGSTAVDKRSVAAYESRLRSEGKINPEIVKPWRVRG